MGVYQLLRNSNHEGNAALAIEVALDSAADLDILPDLRTQAAVLCRFLTTKVVIRVFGAVEVLQHEHVAVVLHFAVTVLETTVPITYKNFLFHGLFRPFSGSSGKKFGQADSVPLVQIKYKTCLGKCQEEFGQRVIL